MGGQMTMGKECERNFLRTCKGNTKHSTGDAALGEVTVIGNQIIREFFNINFNFYQF